MLALLYTLEHHIRIQADTRIVHEFTAVNLCHIYSHCFAAPNHFGGIAPSVPASTDATELTVPSSAFLAASWIPFFRTIG